MSLIAWLIVATEIGFWVLIILGLVTRYILKYIKLGLLLLALTPVIDFILLIATSVDLYRGATATAAHALAAIYIGVSIAFGKSMIEWADVRFQYYITKKGTKPTRRYGMDYAKHYLKGWVRHVLAYIIGAGFLVGLIFFINDAARTEVLAGFLKVWTLVLGIDFAISISYFIWQKKAKE
ncbi:hypothetical protein ACFFF5_07885 [Lederbergia wuyishanensis]|uniref:ABC-type multidrug transport system permease subunit n=1 Tax=Lederbergia wuyishanensis TaxID=1347903 RepID=A0ABU0D6N9_9BACI|nr:hypothetical protein [Lederbergia wuyishanensis]MCJ8008522.1 hypothetical protein [Lederbergia wuyishanensis]MDQ0344064.1 ABC-type multidrug transport system permease subunit [Lederbergia wuyishanensis]